MKKLLLLVFSVLSPFSAIAAVESLPFGSVKKLVEYSVPKTTELLFVLNLLDSNGGRERRLASDTFNRYLKEDGTWESVSDVARRSQDELAALMQRIMRWIVKGGLDPAQNGGVTNLEGRTLSLIFFGTRRFQASSGADAWSDVFGVANDFTVLRDSSGLLTVPDSAYAVDFGRAVMVSVTQVLFIPQVKKAQMVTEYNDGQTIEVLNSNEGSNHDGLPLSSDEDILAVPTDAVAGGALGTGTLRIWYRTGEEQVFNLSNGENLITYLSPPVAKPYRRLGVPKVTADTIRLTVEATDDEVILLERTKNLLSWELFSYLQKPAVVPKRTTSEPIPRVRSMTLPRNGYEFFRAKVNVPVSPPR